VNADDAGDRPPETPTPAARLAYSGVFEAITDGWNRKAVGLLRDLDPAQLDELALICGDVRTLAEAELRRRGIPEPAVPQDFTAAMARFDASPREQHRIRDATDLIAAEDFIHGQALAALERGDREAAVPLLRWCAEAEIGESAWILAEALEAAGEHAEADTWYARAAAAGDERAAITIQINAGSLGTPAARRIRAGADKDAVAEVLRRARENEEAPEGEK
jgi:hypothetical protein